MKKNILVIGSGGREHALGWKLKQSPFVKQLFFAPGNAGTKSLGEKIDIKVTEIGKLQDFAKKNKIDLTIVGPEAPLVLGIADKFKKEKLAIIGPSKKASRIESSKIFSKKLLQKYNIPTADFKIFSDFEKAKKYLESTKYPIVVKADGLCTGKGVAVCSNEKEAIVFAKQLMIDKIFGNSGKKIIIEECLSGQEVSFMVATDGKYFISFLPSQDHKRLKDKDLGPNTGGMGAYTPVPFVDKKLLHEIENKIVKPTINALFKEGCLYQGILYPGLIITSDGAKVLEYNCRFGDPETQPLMIMLETDLYEILMSIHKKNINNQKIKFKKGAAVCVVLAAENYPNTPAKGEIINGLDKITISNIQVFHAGTVVKNNKIVTNGGRVLGVTSFGKDMKLALKNAYSAVGKKGINFKGMQYRKDIGNNAIANIKYKK